MLVNFANCPPWNYDKHPNYPAALADKNAAILTIIAQLDNKNLVDSAKDTRRIHKFLFEDLTPTGHSYYAGNYRGSVQCLVNYTVTIDSDRRVGAPPANVDHLMRLLKKKIRDAVSSVVKFLERKVDNNKKILHIINVVASLFVEFLTIHSYADGNGHAARYLLISLLRRFNLYIKNFSVDPRPNIDSYSRYIKEYRDGKSDNLILMIANCLI